MKRKSPEQRKKELLDCVCSLPRKMTQIHGTHNMTEFVMHHLADPVCFNFAKAAYFIDNPDFDILKGVVGFNRQEAFTHQNHWDDKEAFTNHMQKTLFNQKVRAMGKKSPKKEALDQQEVARLVAQELAMEKPSHVAWPTLYENHGIFIFELADQDDAPLIEESLAHTVYLFGFCPVF